MQETAASADDPQALFATLYRELRQLAERQLRRHAGQFVSPTTVLHETYLDLAGRDARFPDRARFMGYAARAMRGVIIDFVRERRALKRGGEFQITELDTQIPEPGGTDDRELTRLSDALDALSLRDERLAQVVDLRYFCGLSFEEIAALRGDSARTVQRDWEKARLLLFQELKT
jgi:RNA polymerase sigma factor (TIGR02999 family)